MILSVIYKEWIKLRIPLGILLILSVIPSVCLCLQLRYDFSQMGAVRAWSFWMYNSELFYTKFAYVPPFLGLILGLLQYYPETEDGRLRLLLHLPINEIKGLLAHQFIGITLLISVCSIPWLLMAFTAQVYFPEEYLSGFALTSYPWIYAAIFVYLFTEITLLEPKIIYKVCFIALGLGLVSQLFDTHFYNTYQRLIPVLTPLLVAGFFMPLLILNRYKSL